MALTTLLGTHTIKNSRTYINDNFTYLNGIITNTVPLDAITLNTGTEGTAEAANRGKIIHVQGGAGVADTLRICVKDENDEYFWAPLF